MTSGKAHYTIHIRRCRFDRFGLTSHGQADRMPGIPHKPALIAECSRKGVHDVGSPSPLRTDDRRRATSGAAAAGGHPPRGQAVLPPLLAASRPSRRQPLMAHDVISTCPVCQGELTVTRLHCRSCGTALEGEFGVGRFGRLEREQLAFLESFLRSRGNLKEMERELGISYPTVRGRLETLLRALGLGDGDATPVADDQQPMAPEDTTAPAAA